MIYNKTTNFSIKYKWIIQIIIALFVIWVYWDPRISIHPVTATLLILFSYILHSYIENRILIKHLNEKQSNQEQLIQTICKSSSEIITYQDFNGRYIHCNQPFLNLVNRTLEEVKGKKSSDIHAKKDVKILNKIIKQVLQGEIVKKTLQLGTKGKIYEVVCTPLVLTNGVFGILNIAKDITEEITLKKELKEEELKLRSILINMPFATYIKDLKGNVVFENSMAKDFLGLSDSDNANMHNYEKDMANEILKEDAEVINEKHCICREKKITLKNKEERWFNITKCPITNNENEITGLCCVARDIQAEKIAHNQRETYVATLTHDLKTPTIAQIKAIDIILNELMGPINKEQRELLELTKDSCNYMYEMLSTLLSTYKYENGDYILNYENWNFLSIVEETCTELESMLREKNITIHISKDENLYDISCDKIQIKRVITNLLSNEISYAYNDTNIKIKIKKENNYIDFSAENNSSYIKPALMETLFKKYVSHADKFNKIGVGLGLYLSKQIVEAHNGNIYVESFEDNRNIFGFKIPLNNDKILT